MPSVGTDDPNTPDTDETTYLRILGQYFREDSTVIFRLSDNTLIDEVDSTVEHYVVTDVTPEHPGGAPADYDVLVCVAPPIDGSTITPVDGPLDADGRLTVDETSIALEIIGPQTQAAEDITDCTYVAAPTIDDPGGFTPAIVSATVSVDWDMTGDRFEADGLTHRVYFNYTHPANGDENQSVDTNAVTLNDPASDEAHGTTGASTGTPIITGLDAMLDVDVTIRTPIGAGALPDRGLPYGQTSLPLTIQYRPEPKIAAVINTDTTLSELGATDGVPAAPREVDITCVGGGTGNLFYDVSHERGECNIAALINLGDKILFGELRNK